MGPPARATPHRPRRPRPLQPALAGRFAAALRRAADGHPRHQRGERRAAGPGQDLDIAQADIGWTITSYSLVFGSLLLLGGRAADLLGRRRVFLTGLGVFTAASLATALAGDATMLFAARAGQGLGAALLSPAALSIITSSFHGPERAKALGVWGAVGGAGAAIGVLLGGALTELVDWRAIFFINLPVGLRSPPAPFTLLPADAAAPAVARPGPARRAAGHRQPRRARLRPLSGRERRLGLDADARPRRRRARRLAAFAALELRTRRPLLRVQRLADRAVGGGFVMMLAASAVLFGSFLLSSLYLQNVLGTGALRPGSRSCRSPSRSAPECTPPSTSSATPASGSRSPPASRSPPPACCCSPASAPRQLPRRRAARHARRRPRPRDHPRRGRRLGAHRRRRPRERDAVGAEHHGHEIGGSLGVALLATIAAGATGPTAAAGATASGTPSSSPASSPPSRASPRSSSCRPRGLPAQARARPARRRPLADARHADAAPEPVRAVARTPSAASPHPRRRRRRARQRPRRRHGRDRSPAPVSCAPPSTCTSPRARRCSRPSPSGRSARSRGHRQPREPVAATPAQALARVVRRAGGRSGATTPSSTIDTQQHGRAELHAAPRLRARAAPAADRTRPARRDFRADVPAAWHLAMLLALIHAASGE